MRLTRSLVSGLASLALLPAAGAAQQGHLFDNSWFWGASIGTTTYWTSYVSHAQATTASLEWMLTRTHTGLYISLDQSFFKAKGTYTNAGRQYTDSTLTTYNVYGYNTYTPIQNARSLDIALMGFPGSGRIRPYAGLGVAVNWLQGTKQPNPLDASYNVPTSTGSGASNNPAYWYPTYYGNSYKDAAADWVGALLIVGIQAQLSRFSIFGQAKATTVGTDHLFINEAFYTLQAGIRVNVASWGQEF